MLCAVSSLIRERPVVSGGATPVRHTSLVEYGMGALIGALTVQCAYIFCELHWRVKKNCKRCLCDVSFLRIGCGFAELWDCLIAGSARPRDQNHPPFVDPYMEGRQADEKLSLWPCFHGLSFSVLWTFPKVGQNPFVIEPLNL